MSVENIQSEDPYIFLGVLSYFPMSENIQKRHPLIYSENFKSVKKYPKGIYPYKGDTLINFPKIQKMAEKAVDFRC